MNPASLFLLQKNSNFGGTDPDTQERRILGLAEGYAIVHIRRDGVCSACRCTVSIPSKPLGIADCIVPLAGGRARGRRGYSIANNCYEANDIYNTCSLPLPLHLVLKTLL